jgi:hypothetical protein
MQSREIHRTTVAEPQHLNNESDQYGRGKPRRPQRWRYQT